MAIASTQPFKPGSTVCKTPESPDKYTEDDNKPVQISNAPRNKDW